LYNLLLALGFPFIYAYLLHRRRIGKETAWAERWGQVDIEQTKTPRFWVHAVSVGEVMAAAPVVRELRRRFPDASITLSTTTPGGREVAEKQKPLVDSVIAFPIDFLWVVERVVQTVRPDVLILMEWEVWPNVIASCKKHGARIVVLNGRISDKGWKRATKAPWFLRDALAQIDLFLMQSVEDERRATLIGVPATRLHTLGNTKFDESVAMLTEAERATLRAELGIPPDAPVLVCGSTRNGKEGVPDEEVILAEARGTLQTRFPNLVTIVAPRHLERVDEVMKHLPGAVRRTEGGSGSLLVLDTFGELGRVYGIADVAFIGGSLAPWGGQSVFQPLAQGVPALFGPHMTNQRDISALAVQAGVGFPVTDAATLANEAARLLSLPQAEKAALRTQARGLIDQNQGVTARAVERIVEGLL
jgi:3-deoxy-D-manno-octulosonic-acid transferase